MLDTFYPLGTNIYSGEYSSLTYIKPAVGQKPKIPEYIKSMITRARVGRWEAGREPKRSGQRMPVWTWGSDGYGRLGHGTLEKNLDRPLEVRFFSDMPLKIVKCGSAHNIAVDINGRCFTWGKCHYGQLGHGEADKDEPIPRQVESLSGVVVQSLGAGDSHVLAATANGELYSWGVGFYGCLGHGDELSRSTPKLIEALFGKFIVSVSGGASHSVAIDKEGGLLVWGRDNFGQLGQPLLTLPGLPKPFRINQKVPIQYKNLPDGGSCKMVSACNNHTLILLDTGIIIALGCNDNGELGHRSTNGDNIIDPSTFVGYSNQVEQVKYVCAGWKHCVAITETGCLYSWGHGAYGRLGLGHSRDQATPKRVLVPNSNPVFKDVSCGESHTLALDTDDTLWACGSGHYGKLGLQLGEVIKLQPIKANLGRLSGVLCGTNHSVAFKLAI